MKPSRQGALGLQRAAKIAGAAYLIATPTSFAGFFVAVRPSRGKTLIRNSV